MTARSIAITTAILLSLGASTRAARQNTPDQDTLRSVRAWLANLAKLPFTVYDNLSRVRSGADPRAGSRLMLFDVAKQQEVPLWDCAVCWSPVPLDGDRIAVVTPQGIETFSIKTRQHAVRVKNGAPGAAVVEILQAISPARLLVAVRNADNQRCPVQLKFADLAIGGITATGAPADCLGILAGYMKPAWLQNDRLVGNTTQAVARLMEWPYDPSSPSGRGAGKPLSSKLKDDPKSRFDPVWFGNDLVYLETR
jgi:hypothetical protein